MSIARPQALIKRAVAVPVGFVDRIDARLDSAMARVDSRIDSRVGSIASASKSFVIAASRGADRTDCVIERRVEIFDTRVQGRIDAARRHGRHSARYIAAAADGVDFKLDSNVARADRATQTGVSGIVAGSRALVRATESLETSFENRFATADAIFESGLGKAKQSATATFEFINSTSDAFDGALAFGITRADDRIDAVLETLQATYAATVSGIQISDRVLTNAATHVDVRIDRRISQGAYAYATTTNFVMNKASQVDRSLDHQVAKIDTRIDSGFAGLVRAAQAVTYFATDRMDDLDGSLTARVAGIDRRVDAFVAETNGGVPNHAGRRASAAPPWVATTLTLVLGTLGAATGAAALNADMSPVNVDRTVSIEASAAHQAVQQYLGIRDSFTAAAASRNRQISSLQSDIAAAEKQASRTSLPGTEVVDVANNFGGVPYVRGGTSPRGFDCSGYTQYVFRQLGVQLPRTAADQSAWAVDVAKADRKVGDLMFWHGGGGVYHVGIYAGSNMMWDSPYPGRRVGKKGIWGNPTYGRPPVKALNGAAIAEIAAKTAKLTELKNSAPKLAIKLDPQNTLQTPNYQAPAQAIK